MVSSIVTIMGYEINLYTIPGMLLIGSSTPSNTVMSDLLMWDPIDMRLMVIRRENVNGTWIGTAAILTAV